VRRSVRAACVLLLLLAATVARADITEQRRRLPPPLADPCADPITGDWQSQFWTQGNWLARTLRLRRVTPGAPDVVGTELIEAWDGWRDVPARPTCRPEAPIDWYSGQSALSGTFDGARLDVRATPFELGTVYCGVFPSYSPDHFRGSLASAGTELLTSNDDGQNPETTVVFRRVTCGDGVAVPPAAPPPVAAPLPPPREAEGCAARLPGF
jgi:hypothetical protein